MKLKGVAGHKVTVNGTCSITAQLCEKTATETFYVPQNILCYVLPGAKYSVLSKSLCEHLQSLNLVCAVEESEAGYKTIVENQKGVFEGLGAEEEHVNRSTGQASMLTSQK